MWQVNQHRVFTGDDLRLKSPGEMVASGTHLNPDSLTAAAWGGSTHRVSLRVPVEGWKGVTFCIHLL